MNSYLQRGISTHHSHVATNHDLLGAMFGARHHHATIVACSANPVSHDAVSHPFRPVGTILTNRTSEKGGILLPGRRDADNLSERYQGVY